MIGRRARWLLAGLLSLQAVQAVPAHAQQTNVPVVSDSAANSSALSSGMQPALTPDYRLSMWAGLGTSSTTLAPIGGVPDVTLGLIALRLSRRLGTAEERASATSLWYTLDVIPMAMISPSYVSVPRELGCPRRQTCALERNYASAALFPPGSVLGVGVSPLGATAVFRSHSALQFTLGATGGAMWFVDPVPTTRGSEGNFTAALESGAQYVSRCGFAVSFTYRFFHISNAGLADENPAVGSHLFSVGVGRGKPRRAIDSSSC